MKNLAIVSGRGYGKTLLMANLANPEAPTVEELANAIPLEGVTNTGISFTPGDDVTVYSGTNYAAQMSFKRETPASWADEMRNLYRTFQLGQWNYTPAEELLYRLNTRLQGKVPGLPANTRYWRDQK